MQDDEARKLYATTGVDFTALRQKYMTAAAEAQQGTQLEQRTQQSDGCCDSNTLQHNRSEPPLQQRHLCTETAALDKYVICKECSGLGIRLRLGLDHAVVRRKELYNHMVLERSCEHCDGDGIAPRK
eukprot:TRINITY_DN598_c0_g1_i3.p1 TRINITY_DN598_c0_g1~~TRINITY_DN598_c0_g1_i3.p1  ORF type:complete len:141 (-),score=33.11 TRINITY_DN598_c0_g1_i3:296-676(-)